MQIRVQYKQNGNNAKEDTEFFGADYDQEWPRAFVWDGDPNAVIRCCNKDCNGKYNLGFLLRQFERSDKFEESGILVCGGATSSKDYRCVNTLRYRLTKSYSAYPLKLPIKIL